MRHLVERPISAVRAFDPSLAFESAKRAREGFGMGVEDPSESAERDPSVEPLKGVKDSLVQPP